MTPEWIRQAREREQAATPGPWVQGWPENYSWVAFADEKADLGPDELCITAPGDGGLEFADAEFIACAREDVRKLLDVAEAAGELLAVTETHCMLPADGASEHAIRVTIHSLNHLADTVNGTAIADIPIPGETDPTEWHVRGDA